MFTKQVLAVLAAFTLACLSATAAPIDGLRVPATVERVIDGDTIVVSAHIWPELTNQSHIRLYGINAPEIHTHNQCEKAKGVAAKKWLAKRLPVGQRIVLSEIQLGKYAGRVVARVWADGHDIGAGERAAGLAHAYSGGARRPFCH